MTSASLKRPQEVPNPLANIHAQKKTKSQLGTVTVTRSPSAEAGELMAATAGPSSRQLYNKGKEVTAFSFQVRFLRMRT
jgi:hypothetical protein